MNKKIRVFCLTHKIEVTSFYLWDIMNGCNLLIFDLSEGSTPYYR